MEFWQKVHWFTTTDCTRKCRICFRPIFSTQKARAEKLAEILAKNAKKVVLTGGESLLFGELDRVIEILNAGGVDISLHTNADLLTKKRLEYLASRVDEIAIPIDSLHPQTQDYLRGPKAIKSFKRAYEMLQDTNLRVGVHTVVTAINASHVNAIYDYICRGKFTQWSVYEFNDEIVADGLTSLQRFQEIERLKGKPATENDGGVNCLLAKFLLLEPQFARDKRVRFAGVKDYDRNPYFFVNSFGEALYTNWFSQGKRTNIGNLVTEGFEVISKKAQEAEEQGPLFNEELFAETEQNMPLWARYVWQGNFFDEEIENLHPRYHQRFAQLAKLYRNRLVRQGVIKRK